MIKRTTQLPGWPWAGEEDSPVRWMLTLDRGWRSPLKLAAPVLLYFLAGSLEGCAPVPEAPYPISPVIQSVSYDWTSLLREAQGSDNWPITWSDDGHQYTAWGDGGGFGGSNQEGRVSLGFARVEGPWKDHQGFNVWGGAGSTMPSEFGGKSYGIVSVEGVLYAWWGPGSNTQSYEETRLLISRDRALTWSRSKWNLADVDHQLIMPTILNFGQDYAGARDDYVYHYFIRKEPATQTGLGLHRGGSPATGKIDLARVPRNEMMNLVAFEYFAGVTSSGRPIWTPEASQRLPVFEDPNGVGWTVSVSYNSGLERYLLITEHTESFKGLVGMFDAPEPWGPWTTVVYADDEPFGKGHVSATTFFWNFSNKWLSDDGKAFSLIFTGIGEADAWNTVRGTFATHPGVSRSAP